MLCWLLEQAMHAYSGSYRAKSLFTFFMGGETRVGGGRQVQFIDAKYQHAVYCVLLLRRHKYFIKQNGGGDVGGSCRLALCGALRKLAYGFKCQSFIVIVQN